MCIRDRTVTPFVIGFAIYTVIGFSFVVWAGRDLDRAGHTMSAETAEV